MTGTLYAFTDAGLELVRTFSGHAAGPVIGHLRTVMQDAA